MPGAKKKARGGPRASSGAPIGGMTKRRVADLHGAMEVNARAGRNPLAANPAAGAAELQGYAFKMRAHSMEILYREHLDEAAANHGKDSDEYRQALASVLDDQRQKGTIVVPGHDWRTRGGGPRRRMTSETARQ